MIWLIAAIILVGISFTAGYLLKEYSKNSDARKIQELSRTISKQMEQEGLGYWPVALLRDPEQVKRVGRALNTKKMKLVSCDLQKKEYEVLGEHDEVYTIRHGECSCMDFLMRGLPCKHMYFVSMHLD